MSPHRQFEDDHGLLWQAWDVIPSWGERRVSQRRLRNDPPSAETGERRVADRRTVRGIRIGLSPELVNGWLAFECDGFRRRIAPIPEAWETLTDDQLRELWRAAEDLPRRRGRLIE